EPHSRPHQICRHCFCAFSSGLLCCGALSCCALSRICCALSFINCSMTSGGTFSFGVVDAATTGGAKAVSAESDPSGGTASVAVSGAGAEPALRISLEPSRDSTICSGPYGYC